jgi:hypothetical protein
MRSCPSRRINVGPTSIDDHVFDHGICLLIVDRLRMQQRRQPNHDRQERDREHSPPKSSNIVR